MERLGKVKMNYVKPVALRVDLDKDLCEILNVPCGATNFVTSTSSYQEFQICAHFTTSENYGTNKRPDYRNVYSKNNGGARVVSIKGKHTVTFGANPDAYCDDNITNGSQGGCGWQQYSTSGNGDCHYFGPIYVDGVLITQYGNSSELPDGVTYLK